MYQLYHGDQFLNMTYLIRKLHKVFHYPYRQGRRQKIFQWWGGGQRKKKTGEGATKKKTEK